MGIKNKFKDVKVDDEIYSLVFGKGKVIFVLSEKYRIPNCYTFQVEYKNDQRVYYTTDGEPNWCTSKTSCKRTICFMDEVDLDYSANYKKLKKKDIKRLLDDEMIEMRSPAGGWIDASLMPDMMIQNAIKNKDYHLFREMGY